MKRFCQNTLMSLAVRCPSFSATCRTQAVDCRHDRQPLSTTLLSQRLPVDSSHALGKWHLGVYEWQYTPTFRGYESFFGYYSGSQDYYTHRDTGFDFRLDIGRDCGPNCSVSMHSLDGQYSTPLYGDRAVKLVQEHDFEQAPLFIYAAFQSVHCPIEAPSSCVLSPFLL